MDDHENQLNRRFLQKLYGFPDAQNRVWPNGIRFSGSLVWVFSPKSEDFVERRYLNRRKMFCRTSGTGVNHIGAMKSPALPYFPKIQILTSGVFHFETKIAS